MQSSPCCPRSSFKRPGATVAMVAIATPVLVGFAALTVDVGIIYNARADLQHAADAAALAATGVLRDAVTDEAPVDEARAAAVDYVQRNRVLTRTVTVDPTADVQFGLVTFDENASGHTFVPTEVQPNAVRVTVRMASNSPNGQLPLVFANIWGHRYTDVSATAVAAIGGVPRDMVLAIDLSSSMNDDSQLHRVFDGVQVNMRDVWASLDGPAPSFPYVPGQEHETEYAFDSGPALGVMSTWGSPLDASSYDAATDEGLWYLPRNQPITEPAVEARLLARGYSAEEVALLLDGADWENRVMVALGLADWSSGKAGGRSASGGDGDDRVETAEITEIPYPSFRKTWTWKAYRDYVAYDIDPPFVNRFGPKTFVEFLQQKHYRNSRTDLFQTPAQPLQAIKDGVQVLANRAGRQDRMSLISFAYGTQLEASLTESLQSVASSLYELQPGHYGSGTNIGGGLQAAINEVIGVATRPGASKFVVLMSDGRSNTGPDAMSEAQRAADEGIRVFTISVGEQADRDLMQQIASLTGGREYYAAGQPEDYTTKLRQIFQIVGNMGGITLIE